MSDDPEEFADHGFGIALYFSLLQNLLILCFALLLISIAVMIMYVNGGISGDNIMNSNSNILPQDRFAGLDYYSNWANQMSVGRCNFTINNNSA